MDKRKNKNVLKRKGFVVTDITNNNISDCQSSNQKSTNRGYALKKNRFVVKDIDNNNCLTYRRHDSNHQIYNREKTEEEFNSIENTNECEVNNCNEINKKIEDISDSNVIAIDINEDDLNIKCEVISEESNQRTLEMNGKKTIDNCLRNELFENKTLLSDSPLHTIFGYKHLSYLPKYVDEYNLTVDSSRLKDYEYVILKRNWDKFFDDYPVNNNYKLLLLGYFKRTKRYSEENKKQVKEFIKSTNFYLRLGKDLPNRRLQHLIYAARRRLTSLKRSQDLTDNDKQRIRYLYWKRGLRSITEICNILNCTHNCVSNDIFNNFNDQGELFNKGKWSSDEETTLIEALKKYFNTNDLSQHIFNINIKYKSMLDQVNINRSGIDCRSHWLRSLRWKIANYDQFEDKFTRIDTSKLIYCLFKLNYSNESDIDWDFIKDKFSNISSFNNLMKNWRIIKSSVPDFDSKTYKQIIEYLYDNYLPQYVRTDEDLKALEEFYNK